MKILITGHLGFVGRSFLKYFNGKHEILGIDLKEGNDCRDYFKQSNQVFDLVIHLAAIVGGRETIENEPLSVATDLSIDSEFFNWVIKTKQKRVVYFSSSAAYPVHLQLPELKYQLKESDINLDDIKNLEDSISVANIIYNNIKDKKDWIILFLRTEKLFYNYEVSYSDNLELSNIDNSFKKLKNHKIISDNCFLNDIIDNNIYLTIKRFFD